MSNLIYRRGLRTRHLAMLLAAGAAASLVGTARAVLSNWQNPTDGARLWSLAVAPTNFDAVPVDGTTTTLNFRNLWNNAAITANNDIGAFTSISLLTFNNQAASAFTVGQTLAANTLTLAGGSQINQNGGGSVVFAHPIILGSGITTFGGSGNGLIDFGGAITGGSGAGNTSLVVNYSGKGVVQLSGTNTFTGDVRVDQGQVRLTTGGTGAGNTIIMNGGSIGLHTAAATISSPITLNQNTNVFGTTSGQFDGAIGGVGGLNVLLGNGASQALTFTAANTFQGGFTVNSTYNTVAPTTLSGNGAFQNAAFVTMMSGQIITLDNTASTASRLGASTAINLNRGTFALKGNATTAVNQTAGAFNLSGMGSAQVNSSSATGEVTQLTVGSINRVMNGTLNVSGVNLGTTGGTGTGQANLLSAAAPSLSFGSATSMNAGIIPWAIATNTTANFSSLATYDATAGVRPLIAAEYVNPTYVNQGQTLGNARVLGAAATPILAGLNAPTMVAGLVIDTPGAAAATTGTSIYGKSALQVQTGAIVSGLSGGTTQSTAASILGTTSADFNGNEAILHTVNGTVALSNLTNTGSNGLTKSGNGPLTLAGNASTFTGAVTINAGTLNVATDAQLGNPANAIVLAGGTSTSSTNGSSGALNFNPNNQWGGADNSQMATGRSVILGPGGGTISSVKPGSSLRLDGVVSGSGALNVTGTAQLTNTSNTYSGGTILSANPVTAQGSMLTITDDAQLGSGAVTFAGGSLKVDGTGNTITSNRDIVVRNAAALAGNGLILNGANLTLNGTLDSSTSGNAALTSPVSFTKAGSGTLTLTGDNGLRGQLVIGTGTTTPVGNQSTMQTAGEMALSGGGRLASVASYIVNQFGKITLDNTGTSMSNRLAVAPMTLQGGGLEIRAGAGNVEEFVGNLTVNTSGTGASVGSGLDVITLNSVGGGSVQLTTSAYTFTAAQTGLLVRGTNLGNTPGAGNANMFIGNNPGLVTGTSAFGTTPGTPTLTANVIRGMFFDDTATGNGKGLATYDTAKGVVLYTGATALPSNSAVIGTSYKLTSDVSLTGTTQPGSLVVTTSGAPITITNGSNNLNIGGGGAQTLMTLGDSPVNINGTAGNNLSLGSNSLIFNNTTLNVNAPITTSTSSFTKLGTGTLNINSPTITTGSTLVAGQGSVVFGSGVALAATNILNLVVNPGATVDLSAQTTSTIGSLTGYGTIVTPSTSLTIQVGTAVFQGGFSGNGGIIVSNATGSGLTFTGASPNWTGTTEIRTAGTSSATLIISSNDPNVLGTSTSDVLINSTSSTATPNASLSFSPNVTSFARNITTAGNANSGASVIAFNANSTTTLSGDITLKYPLRITGSASTTSSSATFTGVIKDGTGALTTGNTALALQGGGSFTFKNQNTFTGDVSIATATDILGFNQDTIGPASAPTSGPFGKGTLVFTTGGSLRPDGGTRTIGNKISYLGAGTTTVVGVDDLNLTGNIAMGASAINFSIQGRGTTTLSGAITGTGSTLTKSGGSVLNITSNTTATFTDAIAVTQGTLLINGTLGNNGAVTVSDHAILGGSGSFAGGVTVNSGGILAPGNSPGILTSNNNATLASGSIFSVDLNGPAVGTGYDQLAVNGTVNVTGSNLLFSLGYFPNVFTDKFFIVSNDGADTVIGFFAGTGEGTTVNLGVLGGTPITAQISYLGDFATGTIGTGNDVVLYNLVPAPGATSLLGLAGPPW